jgi:twitching motility protein PilI
MSSAALQYLDLLQRSFRHEAVSAPKLDQHVMLWVGTSVSIAGVPLLIGEGELEEIIETPTTTSIPGTKHWVIGLAAHKGGLLPVFSGDQLFRGVSYSGRVRDYCMVIRRPGTYFAITLSDVERDLKFPLEQRDMAHPVDPDFRGFCLGGFQHEDKFLAVLDIDKLVADSNMANASVLQIDTTEVNNDD